MLGHRSKAQQQKMPNHWLVFEVADTGCGIAPEGLQSLFKEFVQVRNHQGRVLGIRLPCQPPVHPSMQLSMCHLPRACWGERLILRHAGCCH